MKSDVFVYDPTVKDEKSAVRGVGRYLQILKENFPNWQYSSNIKHLASNVFINPFFNFLQFPITIKKFAKKQIAVIHDLIPLKYPDKFPAGIRGKFNIFLNKIALRNYDFIVTDSYASKKDIVEILKIPEKKVKVIYPCLPKIFKSETNSDVLNFKNSNLNIVSNLDISASNFCLYVGDATWNKNLVNLAKAIKIINVPCVFVGKVFNIRSTFHVSRFTKNHPWQNELKEFLKITEGDKRFIFPGFVDDYRLTKFYQQAKCNILISRDEGFGFSYLEAASQNCPSVLSNIPVLKEIAKDSALFVAPEKPNGIADAINKFYFNNKTREQFAFKAQQRSLYFKPENFKKNFLELVYE
jgi:glycosyltransferase involved in cell wall biosynthesis